MYYMKIHETSVAHISNWSEQRTIVGVLHINGGINLTTNPHAIAEVKKENQCRELVNTAAPNITLVMRLRGFEALHRSLSAFFLVL